MITTPRTVHVDGGAATIGTDDAGIERAVARWHGRLIDPNYTTEALERWLRKEFPSQRVEVAGFHLGWAPVTNEEFSAFLDATGAPAPTSIHDGQPADHPVWPVPAELAEHYCRWLSEETGLPIRLPTECEWEWAAGGLEHREFPWGDAFDPRRCNTVESGVGTTTPVGAFLDGAAPCGAVDMAGNVEELTSSWYVPYPGGEVVVDDLLVRHPQGYRVLRGGSCMLGGDAARTARRHGPVDGERFRHQGFRIAVGVLQDPSWR